MGQGDGEASLTAPFWSWWWVGRGGGSPATASTLNTQGVAPLPHSLCVLVRGGVHAPGTLHAHAPIVSNQANMLGQ